MGIWRHTQSLKRNFSVLDLIEIQFLSTVRYWAVWMQARTWVVKPKTSQECTQKGDPALKGKLPSETEKLLSNDELAIEYHFDYHKAQPNRFTF